MRLVIVFAWLCFLPIASAAELTTAEKRVAQAIDATVRKAGASYAKGNYEEAGRGIRAAMKQIEVAATGGSADLYQALVPAMQRIEKAHTMLEFEGITLPPFQRPAQPSTTKPATQPRRAKSKPRRRPGVSPGVPGAEPPTATISFSKTVAPILVTRCGRCHASDSKGGFNLATYAALMKGPPEGVVIFTGDTVGSRLIETIETGDMPRGGGQVTPQELQTLKAWILAGAKFDGTDPNAPIAGDVAPPGRPRQPGLEVKRATGNETVSFAGDVAPLLVQNCNGCHIDAMQTRGGLRMDTFAQLLRGGDSGAVIQPGKGSSSLLVQKLRGMVGQTMPAGGRPPFSEDSIQLISTWIDEGATLDGASETQPLRTMSQLAWAAAATSEQISERRRQLAVANLKLVNASADAIESKVTDHFLVIGLASRPTIDVVARLAEAQIKTARTVVAGEPGAGFFRGRATIFVLPRRYDYSEFAKMVEGRGVPSEWTSHWRYDGIDAYIALVASEQDDDDRLADRLAAPVVSLAMTTRGRGVPRWLAEGVGVAVASRNVSSRDRDARRKAEAEISEALSAMSSAKQFLDGKLRAEQTDRIGAAIASSMLDRARRRNFDALVRGLQSGKPFDRAFAEAFRATPTEFVQAWVKWVRGG